MHLAGPSHFQNPVFDSSVRYVSSHVSELQLTDVVINHLFTISNDLVFFKNSITKISKICKNVKEFSTEQPRTSPIGAPVHVLLTQWSSFPLLLCNLPGTWLNDTSRSAHRSRGQTSAAAHWAPWTRLYVSGGMWENLFPSHLASRSNLCSVSLTSPSAQHSSVLCRFFPQMCILINFVLDGVFICFLQDPAPDTILCLPAGGTGSWHNFGEFKVSFWRNSTMCIAQNQTYKSCLSLCRMLGPPCLD